jgi:ferredoxin
MSRLHPLQVKGKYYVDNDVCMFCEACVREAPNHFAVDDLSYVFRQPETPEEEEDCRRAMLACPLEAIGDDGDGSRKRAVSWTLPSLDDTDELSGLEKYGAITVNWPVRIAVVGGILALFGFFAFVIWAIQYMVD